MQFLLGLVVGAGIVSIAVAALTDLPDLVNAMTLPAWMQGVGALLAVGAAIYIPREIAERQWRRSEAERRVRARAMAHLLFPELLELRAQINGRLSELETLERFEGAFKSFADEAKMAESLEIPITPGMERCIDDMHILGEHTATGILQLIALVTQHTRMMKRIRATQMRIEPGFLKSGLLGAQKLVNEAIMAVKPLHDGDR